MDRSTDLYEQMIMVLQFILLQSVFARRMFSPPVVPLKQAFFQI